MEDSRSTLVFVALIILIILVLVGLTWANYRFTVQNPGGNDFLSRWMGTRLFLVRGWSPYSDQTSQAIQEFAYGREAKPEEDQILFVYPFYSIVLVAPYALVGDYALARALWMTTLEVALVILALVSISLSRWKLPIWLLVIVLVFSVLWYHGLRPVINGNPSVLVALFIVLSLLAIRSGQDALAGIVLALTTIKPQMVFVLILFVIIWALSQRRWTLIWSFLGSMAILIFSTSLLIPDWIMQNLRQVLNYPVYTLAGTPGGIFREWLPGVGSQLGWVVTGVLVVILLLEWRFALGQEFRWFFWTACLTLVITNLVGIRTATANFVAMFPALILVFSVMDRRWRWAGRTLILLSLFVLFFGLWWLFLATLQTGDQPIQHPVLFFPLPLYLLIGLYWIRWWSVRPKRLFVDRLRTFNNGEEG